MNIVYHSITTFLNLINKAKNMHFKETFPTALGKIYFAKQKFAKDCFLGTLWKYKLIFWEYLVVFGFILLFAVIKKENVD